MRNGHFTHTEEALSHNERASFLLITARLAGYRGLFGKLNRGL